MVAHEGESEIRPGAGKIVGNSRNSVSGAPLPSISQCMRAPHVVFFLIHQTFSSAVIFSFFAGVTMG